MFRMPATRVTSLAQVVVSTGGAPGGKKGRLQEKRGGKITGRQNNWRIPGRTELHLQDICSAVYHTSTAINVHSIMISMAELASCSNKKFSATLHFVCMLNNFIVINWLIAHNILQ